MLPKAVSIFNQALSLFGVKTVPGFFFKLKRHLRCEIEISSKFPVFFLVFARMLRVRDVQVLRWCTNITVFFVRNELAVPVIISDGY